MGIHQLSRPATASGSSATLLNEAALDKRYVEEVIYQDQIPEFAAATLIRLYDNVYCTLHRIETYESLRGISTYIRRIDSVIQTVILFRDHGKSICAVNQQIALRKEEIEQFAKKVFDVHERAQTISFYALDASPDQLIFPYQDLAVLEENIIYFPSSVEEYVKSLKGQFRKQLRVSKEQLSADQPGYQIKIVSRKEIQAEHIRAILGFAEERMRFKGKDTYTRDIDVPALTKMLRACGHMAIATVDDKICGGAMWFSVGKRHFHQLAAHDPSYDRYMLGNQIWLAAISYSLSLGGSECWLMGGSSAHKARFGAQRKVFNSFVLYRSRLHIFLNLPQYTSMWARDRIRKSKIVIKNMSTKSNPAGRLVKKSLLVVSLIQTSMHHAVHGD